MNTNPAIPRQRRRTEEVVQPARPMRVLTLNPGSTSLKLAVLDGETLRFGHALPDGSGPCWPEFQDLVLRYDPIDAIAIRFAQGGDRAAPVLLDEQVVAELEQLSPRAPKHQQRSVQLARMVREMVPDVALVGCFDTSFHLGLPDHAARYALPRPWSRHPELSRTGCHGLSCEYAHRRAAAMLRTPVELLGLVVAHIGAEVSVTAIEAGRSLDTSTGFTPLDGAVMATRSGSLDPGLVLHLVRSSGLDSKSLEAALTERAGLAGLTGGSGDMCEVLAARAAGDPDAATAVLIYLHRLRREIAAAAMSLSSLDAVVLTGGVAEGSAWLRSELVSGLRVLGARLDLRRNRGAAHDALLSEPGESTAVLLVQAREDIVLARGAAAVLTAGPVAARADFPVTLPGEHT
ncbi:MAG TPA: acetate kinase [Pseudonocardiaceae bacterium]|nr:acetate kinase [Pseudonocardiaceae bacterium]